MNKQGVYLLFGILIAILMIVTGVYLLLAKTKYYGHVTAYTTKSNCGVSSESNNSKVCIDTVTYKVGGVNYSQNIQRPSNYKLNTSIELMYNPDNPNDIQIYNNYRKIMAYSLIGFGILIIFGIGINFFIYHRYDLVEGMHGEAARVRY
jgi:hypothetical protein